MIFPISFVMIYEMLEDCSRVKETFKSFVNGFGKMVISCGFFPSITDSSIEVFESLIQNSYML